MNGSTRVVLISRDRTLVGEVRRALEALPGLYWMSSAKAVGGVDPEVLRDAKLLLVDVNDDEDDADVDGGGLEPLSRLLWLISTSRRRIPVVALAEEYDPGRALAMFRMGATDVLSRADHADQLGEIIAGLCARHASPAATSRDGASGRAKKTAPAWTRPITFSNS